MFRLRIESGTRTGETIPLATVKPTLVVGRGREADVRFPEDATMSRAQAELTWDGTGWTLHNKSQHGTLVGGARVDTERRLNPGDQLTVGGTRLTYEPDPAAAQTLPPMPGMPAPMPATGGGTGDTPPPMPRPVGATPAAVPPGKPTPAAAKPGTPAKPGDPAKKGGSNKMIIVIVALLFGCCCFSGIGYFVVYPRVYAKMHGG